MIYLKHFLYGFFASASFAFLYQTPKKAIYINGVIGGIGWIIYYFLNLSSTHIFMAALYASLAIGLLSILSAKIFKFVSMTFYVPAIIPIVPGSGMYYTMYYLILQDQEQFAKYATDTAVIAIAIAVGVFFSITFVTLISDLYKKYKNNKTAPN